MLQNISYFQQAEKVYQLFAEQLKSLIETRTDGVVAIPIEKIKQHPSPELALFELLQPFGFSPETCNNIYQSIEAEPGKLFISKTHRLIKDRAYWLIEKIENDYPGEVYYIDENSNGIDQPIKLSFRRYRAHEYIIKKHSQVAALDADKIQFPLILRHWHAGDYFIPLGMNNFKKLSDFFIDLKLSRIHKSRIWILANGKDIVWVVGHRIDERYKITSQTNNVLEIIWEE
jgi:tRNA(Ile)-lysidine synthase